MGAIHISIEGQQIGSLGPQVCSRIVGYAYSIVKNQLGGGVVDNQFQ